MKKYITPEIEVTKFAAVDVVTTSGTDAGIKEASLLEITAGELEYTGYNG